MSNERDFEDFQTEFQALEKRVGEKFAAAVAARTPTWPVPDIEYDWAEAMKKPLPPGTMQFPREQWVAMPAARTTALMLLDRLLDFDLDDSQWLRAGLLWWYGGKTRVA